jgi:IS4 transposase
MTDAKVHDSKLAMEFLQTIPKNSILALDLGYFNFQFFKEMNNRHIYFVSKAKSSVYLKVVKEHSIPEKCQEELINSHKGSKKKTNFRIISDQTVMPGTEKSANTYDSFLRLIKIRDEESQTQVEFLTNNFHLSSAMICNIYKQRWAIENFFRLIKQNFIVKTFFGTSQNAILSQIWASLTAVLLIHHLRLLSNVNWSFSNLLNVLRTALFERYNIFKWINIPHCDYAPRRRKKIPPPEPPPEGYLFSV